MTILVIFVSFLIVGNVPTTGEWLTSWRIRSKTDNNDILKVLQNTSSEIDLFHKLLDDGPNKNDSIQMKVDRFMFLSHAYITKCMVEYLTSVEWYMKENPEWKGTRESRDLIGLHGDRGFCVITALHDHGIDVDMLLESVFNSHSLGQLKENSHQLLIITTELELNQEHQENYFKSPENSHLRLILPDSTKTPSENSIREAKKAIVDFSGEFCAQWKPLIPNFLFSKDPGDDYRNHDKAFVRYIFSTEFCEVYVNWDDSTWNCDIIWNLPDYGHEKFKELATQEQAIKPKSPREPAVDGNNVFSLGSLRDKFLNEYISYKNAVNYEDIVSTAILLASIKEGGKILRGIKSVVHVYCIGRQVKDETKWCIDEIPFAEMVKIMLDLRSNLTNFDFALRILVAKMLSKKRIDVSNNPHKKKFDDLVRKIIDLVNIKELWYQNDRESIHNMCREVKSLLDDEYYDGLENGLKRGNEIFNFYATTPVVNIMDVFWFYKEDYL